MNNSELCELAKKQENRGDIEKAYQLYLEAAIAEDDGEAMYALAQMYFEGDYVHQDYDKAGRYFGMAYDHKADIQPWTLIMAGGYWGQRDDRSDEDVLIAIKYYQAAVDLGIGFGHECLGKIYIELGEYDKAYEHLSQMEGRNPCGFYYMGKLYDEGLGLEQDMEKAIYNYKKAVECGLKHEDEYGEDDDSAKAKRRLSELNIDWQNVQ
ncbi:MAG: sel1 repeat family protein [Lachnospiraceae bacterium]|nr:sel1 repeat family protein [Lachnospiraceae bacterium]